MHHEFSYFFGVIIIKTGISASSSNFEKSCFDYKSMKMTIPISIYKSVIYHYHPLSAYLKLPAAIRVHFYQ